jgi:hypothetical protein
MKKFIPDAGAVSMYRVDNSAQYCYQCCEAYGKPGYVFSVGVSKPIPPSDSESIPMAAPFVCEQCFVTLYGGTYPIPRDRDVDVSGMSPNQ